VPPVAREVYWSPGYVGWVRTADYVAWVPLAPGEIYYGRGNYGRHSINIINVNINQVKISNVYRNVNVNNGVTIVERNSFATASPRIVNVDRNVIQRNIFTRSNISVGTPAIKPTRESYFASPRTISQSKLPPQSVKSIQPTQLKQSRPLIKDANKSVLNPGRKPKALPVNTVTTPRTPGKGTPMIQQVKPEEKEKATVPQRDTTGRGEKQQVKPADRVKPGSPVVSPTDRGEKQQVKPEDKKPVAPDRPTGRGEKQQVKPEEKEKATVPQRGPTGRADKQQVKPDKKEKTGVPECGPGQKDEKNPDKCPQED